MTLQTGIGFGHGDPSIEPECNRAHDAAVGRGQRFYLDPRTGLFVMTTLVLLENGGCCGSGCRHCPYPAPAQRAAGRPVCRPQ
jgi:Family of unknown function (DUF5522)